VRKGSDKGEDFSATIWAWIFTNHPTYPPWDQRPLVEGMVLAVEPRAYRDGIVGGRIEDMIRVTADGAEPLTKFSLETLII